MLFRSGFGKILFILETRSVELFFFGFSCIGIFQLIQLSSEFIQIPVFLNNAPFSFAPLAFTLDLQLQAREDQKPTF